MKRGFTLAEVLITLGIIGIVAAMTIPTLITNIKGAQYRAQFKKTISTLNQAVRMNKAHNDFDFSDIDYMGCNDMDKGSDNPETVHTICAIMNGGLKGHTSMLDYKFCNKGDTNDKCDYFIVKPDNSQWDYFQGIPGDWWKASGNSAQFILADGSIVVFSIPGIDDYSICDDDPVVAPDLCNGFIDVNGATGPNREVQCAGKKTMALSEENYEECTVDNNSIGDIFPIYYHGSTVEPLTNAARYVLNTSK